MKSRAKCVRSIFLPVRKNDGRPGAYLTGRFWVWWNWRVSGPRLTGMGFRNGLQKTSSFWAYKNNVSLDHADFEILSRPVQTPTVWGAGHLTKQKQQKWSVVGHATWRDHKFNISISVNWVPARDLAHNMSQVVLSCCCQLQDTYTHEVFIKYAKLFMAFCFRS